MLRTLRGPEGSGTYPICFWNLCCQYSPIYGDSPPCRHCVCPSYSTTCISDISTEHFDSNRPSWAKWKLAVYIQDFVVSHSHFLSQNTKELTAFSTMVCHISQNKFMAWPWTTKCNGAENADTHHFVSYTFGISLVLALAAFESRDDKHFFFLLLYFSVA